MDQYKPTHQEGPSVLVTLRMVAAFLIPSFQQSRQLQ